MASSAVVTHPANTGFIRRIEVAFVADTDGSVNPVDLPPFEGQVLDIEGIDGDPAPTGGWTATYATSDGSTSPYSSPDRPFILTVSGNSVDSAEGKVIIRYSPVVVS